MSTRIAGNVSPADDRCSGRRRAWLNEPSMAAICVRGDFGNRQQRGATDPFGAGKPQIRPRPSMRARLGVPMGACSNVHGFGSAPNQQWNRSYAVGTLYTRQSRESGNPVTQVVTVISDSFTPNPMYACFRRNIRGGSRVPALSSRGAWRRGDLVTRRVAHPAAKLPRSARNDNSGETG